MFLIPILHKFVSATERHATSLKSNFILCGFNSYVLQVNYPCIIKNVPTQITQLKSALEDLDHSKDLFNYQGDTG